MQGIIDSNIYNSLNYTKNWTAARHTDQQKKHVDWKVLSAACNEALGINMVSCSVLEQGVWISNSLPRQCSRGLVKKTCRQVFLGAFLNCWTSCQQFRNRLPTIKIALFETSLFIPRNWSYIVNSLNYVSKIFCLDLHWTVYGTGFVSYKTFGPILCSDQHVKYMMLLAIPGPAIRY